MSDLFASTVSMLYFEPTMPLYSSSSHQCAMSDNIATKHYHGVSLAELVVSLMLMWDTKEMLKNVGASLIIQIAL